MVLPLTVFAVVLVYYNYEGNRRTAYDRILQIARGVATNIDAEFRAAIASLEVLALSEALETIFPLSGNRQNTLSNRIFLNPTSS